MTLSCISGKGKQLFDRWLADPTAIPVSYTYDGIRYRGFPAASRTLRCDSEENGVLKTTLTFALADTLQAVVTLALCPEYGEAEYECVFENNGSGTSAVLEDVHTAEISFAGDAPRLIGILGDLQNQYHPYDRDLTAEDVSFASVSGRATHIYFPYFNLACGEGGYLLAIGWAGTWQADFAYRAGKTDVTLQATRGMKTVLLPGESVSAALTVILPYEGRDRQEAMNLWRRWFLDYNMPRADVSGTPISPFTTSWFAIDTGLPNSDGSISERCDTWQKTVAKLEQENIRLDFHWFDAGWYCAPDGSTVPSDWWGTIGTWDPDPAKWPGNTLREYFDACRERLGMKTLVWFEPERVTHIEDLAKNYGYDPAWAFVREDSRVKTSNIGDPDCFDWTAQRILSMMRKNNVDLYREDNNSDPEGAFAIGNAREEAKYGLPRSGITENKLIRGHYRLWDTILAFCAENGKCTFLDSCASGGGRNDIASMRRSVPFLRSDSDRTTTSLRLSMSSTFNAWIPVCGASTDESVQQLEICSDTDPYVYRASFLPIFNVFNAWSIDPELNYDEIRARLDEWRSIKDYLIGDFFVLTPYHTEQERDGWTAFCYSDRSRTSGIITAFRQEDCEDAYCFVCLPFADPTAVYRFENADTLEVQSISGEILSEGFVIEAKEKRTSVLLRWHKI